MALCTITGFVYLPDGSLAVNRQIVFRREVSNITADYLGALLPDDTGVFTGDDGSIEVRLITGRYVAFANTSPRSYFGVVTVPDRTTANFADIIGAQDIPDTAPVWYAQALAARDEAVAAASSVEGYEGAATEVLAARDQVVPLAEQTAADRTAVEAARDEVLPVAEIVVTQAGIATDAAGLAVAQADGAEASALLADERAGDADTAASAAEAARIAAQEAAIAAALNAGYFDTIAIGRAAVTDGEGFAVRAGGLDGLTNATIFRRDSATSQTVMVEIFEPGAFYAEQRERRSLIATDSGERGYSTEFLARSTSDPRQYFSLGGFRSEDGVLEVSALVVRNLANQVSASRWMTTITSDDGQTITAASDYRGFWRMLLDEASIQHIASQIDIPEPAGGYPMLPMVGGEFHQPHDHIIGIHSYGQSWEARNGMDAGAVNDVNGTPILGAKFPKNVITLNDGAGFVGWAGSTSRTNAADFVAGQETATVVQTPTGAMAFRMGLEAANMGTPTVIFARSEARGGTAIERLMPSGMTDADGALSYGPWLAWEASIVNATAIAEAKGTKHVVHFIPWTHGDSNNGDTYAAYKAKLNRLLDRMSARAMEITGQEQPPRFLITGQPSGASVGYSEPFKVVSDVCRERRDVTFVTGGYGYEMIDSIHWNRWAAVELGELRAIAASHILRGEPWGGPMLANPRRSGAVVTFDVTGAHDVIADESIISDRHQIGGTYNATTGVYTGGAPVPFYGFEASLNGALVAISSVAVDRRRITVTLASAPASGVLQIRYAMHNNMVNTSTRGDGRSANRGNIRADWLVPSMLHPSRTLRRWLASDYFNFSI